MYLSVFRYLLAFLVLVTWPSVMRGEEIKGDASQIRGFIGSQEISACELERVSNSLRHIIALDKGEATAEQVLPQLEQEAWVQLALLHEAELQKIQVSEREIEEFIHNSRRFQVNHRFDPSRYEAVLSHLEIDPREFRRTVKDWLLIDKLFDGMRGQVIVSEEELREAFDEEYELRRARYVLFPIRKYINPDLVSVPLQEPILPEFQEAINQAEEKSIAEAEKYHNLVQRFMRMEGLTFQKSARRLGLNVEETSYFSRDVPPADIQQPDWMWSEAFLVSKGELSRVVPVRDGYLFFTISEIFRPTEKQYSRARENFLRSYRNHKEEQLIEEYKKKVLSRIRILNHSSNPGGR